jgi:two-component system, sensor histidine kinase and response regulator
MAAVPATAPTDSALAQAMRQFLAALPDRVQQLRRHVVQTDAPGLAVTAQALSEASAQVGARSLADLCQQLERMGQSGDLTGAAERVSALEAMADCIAPALEAEPRLAA